VDTLHGITLLFILLVIAANAHSLRLIKQNRVSESIRFDNRTGLVMLIVYLASNAWFIWRAALGE
jgi:hypothetical protein